MSRDTAQLFHRWCQDHTTLNQAELKELAKLGLNFNNNKTPSISPINPNAIQTAIPFSHIQSVFSTESTQKNVQANSTLIAEHQSAGVGQRGKSWSTPLGLAVCFSQRFELDIGLQQMSGYPLTVALACLQTIKTFSPQTIACIKWPNDLYSNGIKFAGILTQVHPKGERKTEVIIGIGINWQLNTQHFAQIDQPVCNIPIDTQHTTRNQFIISLLKQINLNNQEFIQHGFAAFIEAWQAHDALEGQHLTLTTASKTYHGEYASISSQGEIQLNINGQLKRFASGEAQIQKNRHLTPKPAILK